MKRWIEVGRKEEEGGDLPLWLSIRNPTSVSGLRIRHCHELRWRSQRCLGSGVPVAVAQASCCSSNVTPSLGTSICWRCGSKKKKREREGGREGRKEGTVWFWANCLIFLCPSSGNFIMEVFIKAPIFSLGCCYMTWSGCGYWQRLVILFPCTTVLYVESVDISVYPMLSLTVVWVWFPSLSRV